MTDPPPFTLNAGLNGAERVGSQWPAHDTFSEEDAWEISTTMSTTSQQANLLHIRREMQDEARNIRTKLNIMRSQEESAHKHASNMRQKALSLATIRREASNFSYALSQQQATMNRRRDLQRQYNSMVKKKQELSVRQSTASVLKYRADRGEQFRLQKEMMAETGKLRINSKMEQKQQIVAKELRNRAALQQNLAKRASIKKQRVQHIKQERLSKEHQRLVSAQSTLERMKEEEMKLVHRMQKAKAIKATMQKELEQIIHSVG